jgi:putative ABC transport system substrate-binding protein
MRFGQLGRRGFITLLGGVAVSWPLAVRAQQPAMPVIGLVNSGPPEAAGYRAAALRQGLNEICCVGRQNVIIEYRWAGPCRRRRG